MYPELKDFSDFKVGNLVEDINRGLGIVIQDIHTTGHPVCMQIKWAKDSVAITYSIWNEGEVAKLKILK